MVNENKRQYICATTSDLKKHGILGVELLTERKLIASRLHTSRLAAGYNHAADFANAHGLSKANYQQHENGDRALSYNNLKKYATLLDMPFEWLKGGNVSLLTGKPLPGRTKIPGLIILKSH